MSFCNEKNICLYFCQPLMKINFKTFTDNFIRTQVKLFSYHIHNSHKNTSSQHYTQPNKYTQGSEIPVVLPRSGYRLTSSNHVHHNNETIFLTDLSNGSKSSFIVCQTISISTPKYSRISLFLI